MINGKEVLAIIPARGGSKRLPRKNVLNLGGDPLIAWSIRIAKACPLIDRVVVTTDDEEIGRVSLKYGAEIHHRPESLAQDETPSLPVFLDCLRAYPGAEVVVVLQPTSPFRRESDLQKAIETFDSQGADALISVSKMKLGTDWALTIQDDRLTMPSASALDRLRTQAQVPVFQPNGNLYIYTRATLTQAERYAFGAFTLPFILSSPYDLDIDDAIDFRIAEAIAHEFDFHCP